MNLATVTTGINHFSGEAIIDLIFFLTLTFTAGASAVMFFHWKKYGMGGKTLALAEILYSVVTVALVFATSSNLK
jgi:hypothetical protein